MEKGSAREGIARSLILFTVPLILSGVLQQLFNWADALIVGNLVGEKALAAVGATFYVTNLYIMAITGFTSGVSILSARMFGEGSHREQKKVLFTFLVVVGMAAVLLTGAGLGVVDKLLVLMDTPADIFEMAREYLSIVMLGIPCLAIYNVYAAVLRGIGDSRLPSVAVMVSVVGNVALDLVFVGVFHMGVGGAAWATALSQLLMALFLAVYAGKAHRELSMTGGGLFDRRLLAQGSALAVPITIQSVINAVGGLTLQNIMNGFGTQTVAAISSAYRVDSVILLPIINLGIGISTLVAQNEGAGDRERGRKCLYVGCALMGVVSAALTAVVLVVGGPLITLFGVTPESTAIGVEFFRAIAWFYVIFGWATAFRGYLEGTRDVLFSGVNGILALGLRIWASYALTPIFDNMVIAYAEAFSWCFMLGMYLLRYGWKRLRQG